MLLLLSTTPWRRIGGTEVQIHAFFDLGIRWRRVVSFTPRDSCKENRNARDNWCILLLLSQAGLTVLTSLIPNLYVPDFFMLLQKSELFLSVNKYQRYEDAFIVYLSTTSWRHIAGVEVWLHAFLTSALGGEWSASRPGRLTPGERAPNPHLTRNWAGSRGGLDEAAKREKSLLLPGIEPRSPNP